ncbi:MAG: DUF4180 domain-containing protein [Syntrophomonadaceae bacterium]|nr:DUF4180 domain-containing protein [Syntrophomonadaceae bacterium]MDD3024085.1 DUF4180 domain-containing protein [Syntrophomonadaceae bacterium]
MNIRISEKDRSKVAIIESSDVLINNVHDALDLMATISHMYDCNKMVVSKTSITESFFDLKTGLAGEILQKYTNYNMKIAIVGNFEMYNSKSLKDFIFESNKGRQVFFLPEEETAIDRLHNVR